MDSPPHVVDNLGPDRDHRAALAFLAGDVDPKHPLAVATGYVNLGGLHHLAAITDGRSTRLLIGAQPDPGLGADPAGTLPLFERHREALRAERDLSRFPPSRAAEQLKAIEAWLDGPEIEVRRYTEQFLHGKAYLLGTAADPRVALVGSANLTAAGLSRNLELSVAGYGPTMRAALEWFDGLWDRAVDYREELGELLFPDPGLVDPRTVYLRALLELHRPLLDDPARPSRPRIELAPFQRDGYERARAIVREHGGVVYADGVGTGKTEIGLAFIEERTREDGAYALVVAPAQLAVRWEARIHQARLPAQVVSFNALASDEQLASGPGVRRRRLHNLKDAYRLVIVDEAHALRTADTTWYRAMERLLGGTPKDLVLLSATPINNGLWDLHHIVMLFARHDRAFAPIGIDSLRELFIAAGATMRDAEDLDPGVLFPLADAVAVRRDRAFIERHYAGQQFPDGTPVRFPTPHLTTRRYDLDRDHHGLFDAVASAIDALSMARYRPSAWELDAREAPAEAQLAGLLRSGLLKRFESCWRACLETVERMIAAHRAFLAAWEEGAVLVGRELHQAAEAGTDETGLAAWLADRLEDLDEARTTDEYRADFAEAVTVDLGLLERIAAELGQLRPETDPKLATLRDLLETMPDRKVAVFATYGATVRYLHENLPDPIGGRSRVMVIGGETTPDQRTAALTRFAPHTIVRPDYEPPDPVDLLLSTDVLSEGQNLQQAQAVVSYDMPWNPQRVVQRNGRVVRLLSEHDEVHLVTMLAEPGELERLLGLEARVRAKIRAASGVFGMETEVIEGLEREEGDALRAFAARLQAGDERLLEEAEEDSGAFAGEEIRRLIDRAASEGELGRIQALPWGIGACFRQTPDGRSQGAPGVFFAVRTPPMPDEERGYRYWRFVETSGDDGLVSGDLDILRRIDPAGGITSTADGVDLEGAWVRAAADIVAAHNARSDLRSDEPSIGPRQRWALDLLRNPAVALPPGADLADEVLSIERSSAVRRALGEVEARVAEREITLDQAAQAVVAVVEQFGLQPAPSVAIPPPVSADELGVVCWMAVLPPT
jgi:superfamily II DNA or RNA helicase